MEDNSSDFYKAPASNLYDSSRTEDVRMFKRFTAWGVFGLMIITLGIYSYYWLYTRSKTLNTFYPHKISPNLLLAFVFFAVVTFFSGFLEEFSNDKELMVTIGNIVSIINMITQLVVLFSLRNRLKEMTGERVYAMLTLFGGVIYLQYKINTSIDQIQHEESLYPSGNAVAGEL